MKITSMMFLFMICVNATLSMMYLAGVQPMVGFDPGEGLDVDIESLVDGYTGSGSLAYGDPVAALSYWWGFFGTLVGGFIPLMISMGAPTAFTAGLGIVWAAVWVSKIIEVIRGGSFFD